MTFSKENISERLSRLPLLPMLAATIVGIVLAGWVSLPLWVLVVGVLVTAAAAWLWHRRACGRIYLCVAVALLAALSVELHRPAMVSGGTLLCDIEVEGISSQGSSRSSGYGKIIATYRDTVATPCRIPIRITADSAVALAMGTRLHAGCRLYPYSVRDTLSFNRYMARRGFVGGVWLKRGDILHCDTLTGIGHSVGRAAFERLARLPLSAEAMATAAAVTLGRREMLSEQTKEEYRRSGGAHLLAVSGLHVGFVYAIVGVLLGFLLLVRNGQLWRSLLLVAIMWIYVAVVGFSPSVVRAALMFSIMQIIVALSASAFSLNTLFGAAMIILWFSPQMLFDAGFLLSCLSVAAIVEWGVPLIFRIKTLIARGVEPQRTAWRGVVVYVLGWIVSAVVVSIVASLATMPLVAHQFGLASLWGIVSGPLVVALCGVVVGVTLLWIILPIGFLAPVVGWVVESAASAMNSVAAWCAEREGLIFEGRISLSACVVIYLFYIVATVVVWSRERKKLPNL